MHTRPFRSFECVLFFKISYVFLCFFLVVDWQARSYLLFVLGKRSILARNFCKLGIDDSPGRTHSWRIWNRFNVIDINLVCITHHHTTHHAWQLAKRSIDHSTGRERSWRLWFFFVVVKKSVFPIICHTRSFPLFLLRIYNVHAIRYVIPRILPGRHARTALQSMYQYSLLAQARPG